MNREIFQRARSPEEKAQRAEAILSAAAEMLDAGGIEAVTLQTIAARAGIVKSSIYRYFESREEILLRLLLADLTGLVEVMEEAFQRPLPVEAVAETMAGAFAARPRLCLLISQLAPTLERNISPETLRDVKTRLIGLGGRAAGAFGTAVPQLAEAERWTVSNTLFTLVAGLWPMTNPGPDLAALLEEPQFEAFHREFGPALHAAALLVLTGAERVSRAGQA